MSAPPTVPPRPSRAQDSSAQAPATHMDVPKVPARPKRSIERSISPNRDTFARSPLNDPTYMHNGPPPKEGSRLTTEVPPRPPSVSLPSLGEEGNEYASFEDLTNTTTNEPASDGSPPQQTKAVAGDLPLHAPTASVPSSTAKSRIRLVTRTNSSQAEAASLGKQLAIDAQGAQSVRSGQAESSRSVSRPSSLYNEKEVHGIPEIGVQVPMFRNAGDVQAPSPAPFAQHDSSPGVAIQQRSGRHHGRTKSGREIFKGPPGSYGMHGHGVISKDEFEQKWYEKHPEDLKREKAGEYGPHIQENRKEYHWRADNLEKLIHTKSSDIGIGTSLEAIGTPDEQIGYLASEEYASRMTSPRPVSVRPASIQAADTESTLRNETSDEVDESENVIHIDEPAHRLSKVTGGGYDPPTENLGREGGNTAEHGGWVTERGHGMPILASDELKKRGPEVEWRQPAIAPELERHGDEYTINEDGTPAYITIPRSPSRPSSRNNAQAQRIVPSPTHFDRASTALESHKEYEPLFPEDEDGVKKPATQVDSLKRPNLARHHFPSQDVWEDAPGSLQLETTVDTPQAPEEPDSALGETDVAKVFEKPEQEEERKFEITEEDQQSFLSEQTKHFAAENKQLGQVRALHLLRPGLGQRFPSQDIWEDAPSHGHLETTVSAPQEEDTNVYAEDSPTVEKTIVPARPSVPARPAKRDVSPIDKKAPVVSHRPKPQVPARPSKPAVSPSEKVSIVESQGIEKDLSQTKAKPPVPARPGGSKIAALQAGFLKDLNSKLGLGPPAPKAKEPDSEPEPEPEQQEAAAPLVDARKGRAKGPQRRKPASSPVPATTVTAEAAVPKVKLEMASVTAVWFLGKDDVLKVPAAKMAAQFQERLMEPSTVAPLENSEQRPVAEREETNLTKTLTKDGEQSNVANESLSEVSSTVESLLSKVSSAVETPLSKVASAVEAEELLVTETVPESVDAPGAFPGSGPQLDDAPKDSKDSTILGGEASSKVENTTSKNEKAHSDVAI